MSRHTSTMSRHITVLPCLRIPQNRWNIADYMEGIREKALPVAE
ncbi:hypothetical protein BPSOL_0282 [Bifidobacterium pseudolongum]|nr:hypothetical protein BPSOL_0282 [Bifidobacterium pseudolongum]